MYFFQTKDKRQVFLAMENLNELKKEVNQYFDRLTTKYGQKYAINIFKNLETVKG